MTDERTTSTSLCIPHSHPALPGHFPGQPIVPGVVLIDHVLQAAQAWLGGEIQLRTLQQAKFVMPLLADQQAQIQLKLQGTQLRFTVSRGAEVIAQGMMSIAGGIAA